ncbi:MAG TPA: YjbH domain-containing protein, partial [Arenibaculum sp.]|nr:YjbH domain-containing protein [Arenibaculum sp.]
GTAERRLAHALAEVGLAPASVRVAPPATTVWLDRLPRGPAARTVGRTARVMAREAPPEVELFEIVLRPDRLDGSTVGVLRGDLERAASHRGSPAELWRTARLEAVGEAAPSPPPRWSLRLTPRVEIDPAGPGGRVHKRAAADLGVRRHDGKWLLTGVVRFNLAADLAAPDPLVGPFTIRGDVADHAALPVGLAELHSAWLWSPGKGWHLRYAGGLLEEMFGGHSAEVLLRPPGARWAVGLQADFVAKRPSHASFVGRVPLFSSMLGAYYESAGGDAHGALHLGRYLGGDRGATLELERRLPSGLTLRAHATWTDATAGRGGADIGFGMALPLGLPAAFPLDVTLEASFRRLGRDAGQRLDQPLPLYRLTGPGSYGRVAGSWRHVLE